MTTINNINEFANSIYAKSPLFKAATIEESFAKYQEFEAKKAAKAAKKFGKAAKKVAYIRFTMETLKANRNEIIADILRECDKENLAVVMNKMVSMINEGNNTFKSVLAFVSAAEEELREDGIEVINAAKAYSNLQNMIEAGKRQQMMAL